MEGSEPAVVCVEAFPPVPTTLMVTSAAAAVSATATALRYSAFLFMRGALRPARPPSSAAIPVLIAGKYGEANGILADVRKSPRVDDRANRTGGTR